MARASTARSRRVARPEPADPSTLDNRNRALASRPDAPVDDQVAAALKRRRMRLLEDHLADAEQRRHHGDAETEAGREHRACGPDGSPAIAARAGGSTRPASRSSSPGRRDARAASAGLCVTTTMAVPSAWTRSNSAAIVLAGVLVELAGRLVGEQQRRPVRQRARDRDALHLAAGELRRPMIARDRRGRRNRAARASGRGARRQRRRLRPAAARRSPRARQHRQQEEALEDEPDARQADAAALRFRQRCDVATLEQQRSARRRIDAAEQVQQRRLAAARRPGDRDVARRRRRAATRRAAP